MRSATKVLHLNLYCTIRLNEKVATDSWNGRWSNHSHWK